MPNFKKDDVIQVSIIDLAFGGVGVGKFPLPDGKDFVIFVEGIVPGDIISARLTRIKKNYAEAKLEKIEQKSSSRITPRCKHFGLCGGCALQFLNYEDQLKFKEKMVRDSLRTIGGFDDIKIEPIIGCKESWFYRNKMEYTFGRSGAINRATTPNLTPNLTLGLHPRKNYKEVFDLEECFLQSQLSAEITIAVKKWMLSKNVPAYDPRINRGVLRNLIIREGKNTGEIMVNLVTNGNRFNLQQNFSKWISENFSQITSLYHTTVKVQKGKKTHIEEFLLSGKKTLKEILNVSNVKLDFEILPQAFFQPNTKQAEVLYGKIIEFAEPKTNATVVDLFCGTGTIGMFFAKSGHSVFGIDSSKSAIENARENAKNNNISNINFVCGDIDKTFDFIPSTTNPLPSILITDPPRAGIFLKSLLKIIDLKIPRWIYVSCNPSTLARDLKIICANGDYKIERIQPVDMFPHTYHVETVCRLDLQ